MKEHLASRQRRRELLITLAFTVFSVLMIVVTSIERWPVWYIPLIAIEVALVWWCYIRGYSTHFFRAFLVTVATCTNIFLYGIQAENFVVIIPTLCTQIVLLSLYEITQVIDYAILETAVLFAYHVLVKKTFVIPEDSLGRNRLILQLLSFVALIVLCYYRIYHHIQEERDIVELEHEVLRELKIKEDFVANTSHELRTPVNTISGMCEILLQKTLPDDVHTGVLDIQMTGVELQNIVNDIMDYAALEANTLELSPRAYNITSTLNDVMNMTVFENKDKNLEIIFDCDPTIPCLLEGDEQQLRRVLNNIISNAIKFTSEGGVTVCVSHRPEAYGINLIVSVKDTGVGMSVEEQERILRGFYQIDADRNRKSSGIGLGLTISYELIKKMGGFMTIKSKQGEGSEFTFAIPQKVLNDQPCISILHPGKVRIIWYYNLQSDEDSMRDAFANNIKHFSDYLGIYAQRVTSIEECKRRLSQNENAHIIIGKKEYIQDKGFFDDLAGKVPIILISERDEQLSCPPNIHVLYKPYNAIMLAEIINGSEQAYPVQKKKQRTFTAPTAKILVVDDNIMNLKVVEGLLRKYRIKIVAASSGEEALSLIESKDFDFVFMDHMMPGMDGVECYHRIREKAGTYYAQVPIIALTANAIAGSREMFLNEGFNEFIAKPIDTSLLNNMLQRFIPFEKQIFEEDEIDKVIKQDEERAVSQIAKEVSAPKKRPEDPFTLAPDIDKETAVLYCGSEEDFAELAAVYLATGKNYSRDLQVAYEDKDFKNYAILSHTIKSTSKTLGALHLSDLAYAQEMNGKAENEEEIAKNHEEFLAEYKKILGQLAAFLDMEETDIATREEAEAKAVLETSDKKATIEEYNNWSDLKRDLKSCLEAYETNLFEEHLEKAKGFKLSGQPIEKALEEVLNKASNFEFDEAIELLDKIGGDES